MSTEHLNASQLALHTLNAFSCLPFLVRKFFGCWESLGCLIHRSTFQCTSFETIVTIFDDFMAVEEVYEQQHGLLIAASLFSGTGLWRHALNSARICGVVSRRLRLYDINSIPNSSVGVVIFFFRCAFLMPWIWFLDIFNNSLYRAVCQI